MALPKVYEYSPTPAAGKTFRYAPSVSVPLYVENFDSTALGSLPTGWETFDSQSAPAEFVVSDDYSSSGSNGLKVTRPAFNSDQRVWYSGLTLPQDCQVVGRVLWRRIGSVRVMGRVSGSTGFTSYNAGLQRDDTNLYLKLYRSSGTNTELASVEFFEGIPNGTFIKLVLYMEGANIKVRAKREDTGQYLRSGGRWDYSNPVWAIDYTDATPLLQAGYVGFRSTGASRFRNYNNQYFDDIACYPLTAEIDAASSAPAEDPAVPVYNLGDTGLQYSSGTHSIFGIYYAPKTAFWITGPNVTLNFDPRTKVYFGRDGSSSYSNSHSAVRLYTDFVDGIFGTKTAATGCTLNGGGNSSTKGAQLIGYNRGQGMANFSGYRQNGITIQGWFNTKTYTRDSVAIRFLNTGTGTASFSQMFVEMFPQTTTNRMDSTKTVALSLGADHTTNNVIVFGCQGGISCSIQGAVNMTEQNCFVSQESYATDPYAFGFYKQGNGCAVQNNVSMPLSFGRGIILQYGGTTTIQGNVVFARETAVPEYPDPYNSGANAFTPTAMRSRFSPDAAQTVDSNVFLGIAGSQYEDALVGCNTMFLSDDQNVANTFSNNWIAAVWVGATDGTGLSALIRADALTISDQGSAAGVYCNDTITGNSIYSNQQCMSLSDADGYDTGAHNDPISLNTFGIVDGDGLITQFLSDAQAKLVSNGLWSGHPYATEVQDRYNAIAAQLTGYGTCPITTRSDNYKACHIYAGEWYGTDIGADLELDNSVIDDKAGFIAAPTESDFIKSFVTPTSPGAYINVTFDPP